MMGPTLFVHLGKPLSSEDTEAIHAWLSDRTIRLERQNIHWEFHFTKDSCASSLAIVPFGAESLGNGMATEVHLEGSERYAYETALGFCPVVTLQLDNFCRHDDSGHQLLAQLAVYLARQHNGLIAVGSAVVRMLSNGEITGGQCHAIRYSEIDDSHVRDYEDHLVDADFMEEWARHPDFHLEI